MSGLRFTLPDVRIYPGLKKFCKKQGILELFIFNFKYFSERRFQNGLFLASKEITLCITGKLSEKIEKRIVSFLALWFFQRVN